MASDNIFGYLPEIGIDGYVSYKNNYVQGSINVIHLCFFLGILNNVTN
jgi:hypothetical protein